MTVNKNQKTLLLLPSAHCQVIRPSLINGTKAPAEQNYGKFLQQANPTQLFFPILSALMLMRTGSSTMLSPSSLVGIEKPFLVIFIKGIHETFHI